MTNAFATVIGHERAVQSLGLMLAEKALPPVLIFFGPRHVGKRTIASLLAGTLLGVDDPSAHPDFRLVERPHDEKTGKLKKLISIDAIRFLQEHLRLSSFLGGAKVALIDGADFLSEEAANALLKTLEEPTPGAHVFLCVEDITRVPRTIQSRAALVELRRLPELALAERLVAGGAEPLLAARAAARSDGRPGLALGFLGQADMVEWYETEERRWRALRAASPLRRLSACAELAPARADREETVDHLRDVLDIWQHFLRQDLKAGEASAISNLRRLQTLRASLDANVQPRLLLEKFALTLDR